MGFPRSIDDDYERFLEGKKIADHFDFVFQKGEEAIRTGEARKWKTLDEVFDKLINEE